VGAQKDDGTNDQANILDNTRNKTTMFRARARRMDPRTNGIPILGTMRKIGSEPSKIGARTRAIAKQMGDNALKATSGSTFKSCNNLWVAINLATSAKEPASWKRTPTRTLPKDHSQSVTYEFFVASSRHSDCFLLC